MEQGPQKNVLQVYKLNCYLGKFFFNRVESKSEFTDSTEVFPLLRDKIASQRTLLKLNNKSQNKTFHINYRKKHMQTL